jgi:hypothetical protein
MSSEVALRSSLTFVGCLPLLFGLALACGREGADPRPDPEGDASVGDGGADAGRDASDAGSPTGDAGRDGGSAGDSGTEGGIVPPEDEPFDAGLPVETGTPVGVTCVPDLLVTPGRRGVVYRNCAEGRTYSVLNVETLTTTNLGAVNDLFVRPEGIVYRHRDGGDFKWVLADDEGRTVASIPHVQGNTGGVELFTSATTMVSVFQHPVGELRYEERVVPHDEQLVFATSDRPSPFRSATFRVQSIVYSHPILSEDGKLAAVFEEEGPNNRLRVAKVEPGASVNAFPMPFLISRWLVAHGNGALALDKGARLHHVDFVTGEATQLSSQPMLLRPQPTPYALAVGPYVYFVEGVYRSDAFGSGPWIPGAFVLKRWDSRAKTTPPVTLSRGDDYRTNGTYFGGNRGGDWMRLTPDGKHLVYTMEATPVGLSHRIHELATADEQSIDGEVDVFAPAIAVDGWSGTFTVRNLASGARRSFTDVRRVVPSGDADTVYLMKTSAPNGRGFVVPSITLEVASLSSPERKTLLHRPRDRRIEEFKPDAAVPVLSDGIVMLLPVGVPQRSLGYHHELRLFRK